MGGKTTTTENSPNVEPEVAPEMEPKEQANDPGLEQPRPAAAMVAVAQPAVGAAIVEAGAPGAYPPTPFNSPPGLENAPVSKFRPPIPRDGSHRPQNLIAQFEAARAAAAAAQPPLVTPPAAAAEAGTAGDAAASAVPALASAASKRSYWEECRERGKMGPAQNVGGPERHRSFMDLMCRVLNMDKFNFKNKMTPTKAELSENRPMPEDEILQEEEVQVVPEVQPENEEEAMDDPDDSGFLQGGPAALMVAVALPAVAGVAVGGAVFCTPPDNPALPELLHRRYRKKFRAPIPRDGRLKPRRLLPEFNASQRYRPYIIPSAAAGVNVAAVPAASGAVGSSDAAAVNGGAPSSPSADGDAAAAPAPAPTAPTRIDLADFRQMLTTILRSH